MMHEKTAFLLSARSKSRLFFDSANMKTLEIARCALDEFKDAAEILSHIMPINCDPSNIRFVMTSHPEH
jgi:hypothetical protein